MRRLLWILLAIVTIALLLMLGYTYRFELNDVA